MKNEKHNIQGYEEKSSIQLAGCIVIFAERPDADEPYMVVNCKWDNPFNVYEYYKAAVTADYFEAVGEYTKRQSELLEQLVNEQKISGIPFKTLTVSDCIPNGLNEDINNKIIVIKPEILSPEYRTATHQLKLCTGGFGTVPDARGNAVFCTDIYSGRQSRFEKRDVAGVIDPIKMPEWANFKLMLLQDKEVFEYGGKHFKPYRKFEKRDGGFDKYTRRLKSDHEFGITKYVQWQKADYSHASFYEASKNSECDIFKCLENGKLYVPAENELFQYNEPEQKKTKTLSAALDNAKQKVKQENTTRNKNSGIKSKKRNDVEVD